MALYRNIVLSITISDKQGADFSDIAAAIEAGGTIKTFCVETPMTLTRDLVVPPGVTLIIGSEASLNGGFSLTGNNTVLLFEGRNKAIGSGVSFLGTWAIDELDICNFNVFADGVTDDTAGLQQAFSLAKLTTGKRVNINGVYKVTSVNVADTVIVGHPKFIGTNGYSALSATGSKGSFYSLNASGNKGDQQVTCTNTTFIASLKPGDLINVTSDALAGDGYHHGEIVEIESIDPAIGVIKSRAPLHYSYLTAENARVARIEPVRFSNEGQIFIEFPVDTLGDISIDRHTIGLGITYGRDHNLNVKTFRSGSRGIVFSYCYRPRVIFSGTMGECPGYGYGVSIVGATMHADVTGRAFGFRHCIHHGGSTDGIPWNSHIHDTYAAGMLATGATMYDTHPSVGSVTFTNCVAEGDSTYSGGLVGFTTNGRNTKLINCEARFLGVGMEVTDATCEHIMIKNFRCLETNYGVLVGPYANVADQLIIEDVQHINKTVRTGATLQLAGGTVANLYINGIIGHNISRLINLTTGGLYPSKIEMGNLKHHNISNSSSQSIWVNDVTIDTLFIHGFSVRRSLRALEINSGIQTLVLRDFNIQDIVEDEQIKITGNAGIIDISGGLIINPQDASSCIISCSGNVATMKVSDIVARGVNLKYITRVASGMTFSNFMCTGNVVADPLTSIHNLATPANSILDNNVGI
jgi:hypothetical protein